jgi:adenylate kinase
MDNKTVVVLVALAGLPVMSVMAAEEPGSRDQVQVYGWQMMTEQEREQHRNTMRNLHTEQEREAYRQQHHMLMKERARERGVSMPEEPMPRTGMGSGMRGGPGMGGR